MSKWHKVTYLFEISDTIYKKYIQVILYYELDYISETCVSKYTIFF